MYRLNSYVEGSLKGSVTFTNQLTGEYEYFEFTVKVVGVEIFDIVTLEAPVRQSSKHVVVLENPLGATQSITMGPGNAITTADQWWTCDSKDVRVNELRPISGNLEGSFEVEYRPTVLTPNMQAQERVLKILTKELGDFLIKLILIAQPPVGRPKLYFNISLGKTQIEYFVFSAYNRVKCEYSCSVSDSAVFNVQKTLAVDAISKWEGETLRLAVTFDPSEVGECRDVLKVLHQDGGSYDCDLVAICSPPQPQGPFSIAAGSSVPIPFRNCFTSSVVWSFSVDSPNFKLASSSTTVAAKTDATCVVTFEPKIPGSNTAKLFITSGANPPWVFYLRGT